MYLVQPCSHVCGMLLCIGILWQYVLYCQVVSRILTFRRQEDDVQQYDLLDNVSQKELTVTPSVGIAVIHS
jgi:hypothetical protein